LPVTSSLPWLLADARSGAASHSSSTADTLAATTSAILNESGLGEPEAFHRPNLGWEIFLLAVVSGMLGAVAITPSEGLRWLALAIITVVSLALPYLLLAWSHWWLPTLPILAALIPAYCVQTIAVLSAAPRPH